MCEPCTKSRVQFPAMGVGRGRHIKLKHKTIKKNLIVQKKRRKNKIESSSKQIPSHRGSHFEFLQQFLLPVCPFMFPPIKLCWSLMIQQFQNDYEQYGCLTGRSRIMHNTFNSSPAQLHHSMGSITGSCLRYYTKAKAVMSPGDSCTMAMSLGLSLLHFLE